MGFEREKKNVETARGGGAVSGSWSFPRGGSGTNHDAAQVLAWPARYRPSLPGPPPRPTYYCTMYHQHRASHSLERSVPLQPSGSLVLRASGLMGGRMCPDSHARSSAALLLALSIYLTPGTLLLLRLLLLQKRRRPGGLGWVGLGGCWGTGERATERPSPGSPTRQALIKSILRIGSADPWPHLLPPRSASK